MKFQEIFNEYVELLPYMVNHKNVFLTTTLYNSYIKPIFADKEVSILLIADYQNFTNDLLLPNHNNEYMSRDRIEQIIDVLINISRFAIKSNYGISENFPQQIQLDFNSTKSIKFEEDLENIQSAIAIGETFISIIKSTQKIINYSKLVWLNGLRNSELDTRLSPTVSKNKTTN